MTCFISSYDRFICNNTFDCTYAYGQSENEKRPFSVSSKEQQEVLR